MRFRWSCGILIEVFRLQCRYQVQCSRYATSPCRSAGRRDEPQQTLSKASVGAKTSVGAAEAAKGDQKKRHQSILSFLTGHVLDKSMRMFHQARMGCWSSGARLLCRWGLKLRFRSSAITGGNVMSKGGSGGGGKGGSSGGKSGSGGGGAKGGPSGGGKGPGTGGGWPSGTGKPSGGGRSNAPSK